MSVIYVKGKEGRLSRTSRRGQPIPHDKFIPVVPTKFIDRMVQLGDIEVQAVETPKAKAKPKSPPEALTPPVAMPPESE